jgi:adenosylhomocysteine nucleosidase
VITGIVIALAEELGTLTTSKLGLGEIAHLNDNIQVIYSGAGADNAKAAAETLVKQGVSQLISWGCAAALADNVEPGTLVFAEQCIGADKSTVETDKQWLKHAMGLLAKQLPISGIIAESNQIIVTGKDKLELGVATNAIALDMESAAIARVAKANGLPFLAIRAIADPQSMNLPKAIGYAVNQQGEVALGKLAFFVLLHPAEIPGLVKLGLHFNAAKKTLTQAATFLDEIASFVPAHQST